MWVWYVIASVLSGIIAGMGMGGGTLLIPVLTIFFKIPQHTAQALNLFAFLPTAVVSLVIHFKNHLVDVKKGLIISSAGVCASIAGSILAGKLRNEILQKLFGVFLLVIGLWQIVTALRSMLAKPKRKYKYKVVIGTKRDLDRHK